MIRPSPSLVLAAVALAAGFGVVVGGALHAESEAVIRPGQLFALAVGETAVVNDTLYVSFASVAADSRCPADVHCVWEGNAEIEIEVAAAGHESASLTLNTNPSFEADAAYLMYVIRLIDLQPYPRTDSDANELYTATLLVDLADAHPTLMPNESPSPTPLLDR